MQRGQIVFDFLMTLSALTIIFAVLMTVVHLQKHYSTEKVSQLVMERICEDLSQKVVEAKIEGDGSVKQFYSRLPLVFKDSSREVYIAESYTCILPEHYFSEIKTEGDGAFKIENKNGKIIITRYL